MRISDAISAYILHMLEEADDGAAELQRNLLAEELGCVPSQINYVLASRFTPEQGYIIESRRGGGGYIRIRRVRYESAVSPLMHTVNSIGDALPLNTAVAILDNLVEGQALAAESARVMLAAISDRAYRQVPPALRDLLRATQFKQMLTAVALQNR